MKNPRLILLLVLAVWSALPSLAQDDTCPYLECRYTSQAKFNALNKDKVNQGREERHYGVCLPESHGRLQRPDLDSVVRS